MKWIYHILAVIYTKFVFYFFKISPPNFLFHKPKSNFPITWIEEIHADESFTTKERQHILEAAADISKFSNGWFLFDIKFDLKITDESACTIPSILIRSDHKDEVISYSDGYFKTKILGLYYRGNNNTRTIHLVEDRLNNDTFWRTVTIHELGHLIGLQHTKKPSIMHKNINHNVLYPTYLDAVEFAKLYGCEPNDLRYFKLRQ